MKSALLALGFTLLNVAVWWGLALWWEVGR